jgi:protein O-GlcNAc transferase
MNAATANQALLQRAIKLQKENNLDAAKKIYLRILETDPSNLAVLHPLGILYSQLHDYKLAIDYLTKAISLNPQDATIYYNLGVVYQEKNDPEKATHYFQHAVKLNSQYSKAHHKLAKILYDNAKYTAAAEYFQKALATDKQNEVIWFDYGMCFLKQSRFYSAIKCFKEAIKLKPDLHQAYFYLGHCEKQNKAIDEAMSALQKALELEPSNPEYYSRLVSIWDEICDWRDYPESQRKLRQLHNKTMRATNLSPLMSFSVLSYNWDPKEILNLGRSYADSIVKKQEKLREKLNFKFEPIKKPRLKIGYFSSDFCNHPVAHLTNNLFSSHNRDQFEIFTLSHGEDDKSSYRQHIQATSEHFIDFSKLRDEDIAKQIHSLGIDILVDLNGYTANEKTSVLALRPAPIQLSYLGFLGTLGANFIDYTIVDDVVAPPGSTEYYSEKLVYLPHCYQICDNKQVISDKPLSRKDYGLPEDAFVYCSFNNSYKIEPAVFNVWAEILTSTPNSILWLFRASSSAEQNLRREAEQRGIAQERLIFTDREDRPIYMARYRLADIFLDSFVYNANTTGNDALWAGLPLLTCPGNYYPNRGAASMLTALGLPELIANSHTDYRDKAIYFYQHPDALKKMREKLQQQKLTSPLFDTQRFVRNLERAYSKIWDIYASGSVPQEIRIIES